jgi:uncharacterized membrane-anchored protein
VNSPSIAFVPIAFLTIIGVLLVALGLFVGGEIELVIVSMVPLAIAGVLGVFTDRRR